MIKLKKPQSKFSEQHLHVAETQVTNSLTNTVFTNINYWK